jgi:hypothetical protein
MLRNRTGNDRVIGALDAVGGFVAGCETWACPLGDCGGGCRDSPNCSVNKEAYYGAFNYLHRGCCGCGHACDSCWDVKVRATESCRWRPQRFEYSQCGIDGFAVDSTFLEVEVQGVGNGTGRSNCQSECESSEKMHCEGWYVTEFVGVGRVGGSFDNYAEFLMDCQDSLSSTIYYSASIGI